MLTYFKCPDGQKRLISDCLAKCGRPEGRCMSLPSLTSIGKVRPFTGLPSTTQLLNPSRMEYLKIVKPYAVDPFSSAFALLGTRHHGKLEAVAKKIEGLEAELALKKENSGILDLLEPNGEETFRLTDYKTYGSYAAAKHLFKRKGSEADRRTLALQLGNYRLLAEDVGFKVTELFVQITVRDGNTRMARENDVFQNIYFLPVEMLPDDEVREYFARKKAALLTALETNALPALCDYDERWGGRRCKLPYCELAYWCPEGAKVNKLEYQP